MARYILHESDIREAVKPFPEIKGMCLLGSWVSLHYEGSGLTIEREQEIWKAIGPQFGIEVHFCPR